MRPSAHLGMGLAVASLRPLTIQRIMTSVVLAGGPDFDVFVYMLYKRKANLQGARHHEFASHSLGFWALVFCFWKDSDARLALLGHFVQDYLVAADGVRLFYPLKRMYGLRLDETNLPLAGKLERACLVMGLGLFAWRVAKDFKTR